MTAHSNTPGAFGDPKEPALRPRISRHRDANGDGARPGAAEPDARDWRRTLQLALAALWLLDAVLQFQTFMFSQGFPRMLAATATGNPRLVAGPVTWSAHLFGTHPGTATAVSGTLQLLLGLGIAWRPAVRVALAASAAWALAVWWLGEGLGGVLTGTVSPVTGAPGAALLYALLAVLLWPARPGRERQAPFAAAAAAGAPVARALWLALWGGLAWLAATAGPPPGPEPDMAGGDPHWLRSLGAAASGLFHRHPAAAGLATAVLFAVIAAGIYLPRPAARAVLGLAALAAVTMWVAGQDFGGLFTRATTDPDTAPLLVLLAAAYWPAPPGAAARGAAAEHGPAGEPAHAPGSPEPRPLAGVV